MAGGLANKNSSVAMDALAKIKRAEQAIQQASQKGLLSGSNADPLHGTVFDPAITAAIAALNALV